MTILLKAIKYNAITGFLMRQFYRLQCRSLKNIIFVATTGRSGTMTLVDIFNHIPYCKADHEPYPGMFDDILVAKSSGNEALVKQTYWQIKSVNLWRAAAGFKHYFESNHMFIKTYIEYAVADFADKVVVVHLFRDPVKVANSIYALQDFPGTVEGNKWWLDYTAENNMIKIVDYLDNDPEFKHPFYKGLWYWYETEKRIADWKKRLPHIQFIDFKTEDFNDHSKTFTLLNNLGIDFDADLLRTQISTQSNTRPHQKIAEPLPLEQAKAMHERFKALLTSI
jgi:ribosomal protein L31